MQNGCAKWVFPKFQEIGHFTELEMTGKKPCYRLFSSLFDVMFTVEVHKTGLKTLGISISF